MADEIIEELWAIKDEIAKEADYDVDKLIDLLEKRQQRREDEAPNRSGGEDVPCGDNMASPAR